jgi:itaconyl-CoA hydratase
VDATRLTGSGSYFEDFAVGDRLRHARGKTVTDFELQTLCHLVMNTAQGHFNEELMSGTPFGGRIVFGGITAAIVVGLAMQDTGEHALAELAMDEMRFREPVAHGDTLYALSEVMATEPGDRDDAGEVTFRHWGINQRDEVVFETTRRALIKRRVNGVADAGR